MDPLISGAYRDGRPRVLVATIPITPVVVMAASNGQIRQDMGAAPNLIGSSMKR